MLDNRSKEMDQAVSLKPHQFNFICPEQTIRNAISSAYRLDEIQCVHSLLIEAQTTPEQQANIQKIAKDIVAKVRKARVRASGVDALMHEFSLSSEEGVALMCLAEALLRIPDKATANKLIRDKISKGQWRSHLGNSASLFVNASAWGLLITGKLVSAHDPRNLSGAFTRMIAKGGEPLIRRGMDFAMKMLGKQFVTGETIAQAIENGKEHVKRGYCYSYDMLGEAAMTRTDAQKYLKDYENALHVVGESSRGLGIYRASGISVKLSAIHPKYHQSQYSRVMTELYPALKSLFLLAKKYDIGLNIDAEEADRLDISLDLIEALLQDEDLKGFDGIGVVVQAYQKRCPFVIDALIEMARKNDRKLMVRLVKGAYWDAEIKRAQADGLEGYPVYTRKVHSDIAYIACTKKLLAHADVIYPQFATHNAHTLAAVYELARQYQVTHYEFQCLHGMGESLYDHVVGADNLNIPCRIYAPVGAHDTLLAYLVRRILENGSNSSFVNQLVDESISLENLVADPTIEVLKTLGTPHPKIPEPIHLYGRSRINSKGFDISNPQVLSVLQQAMNATFEQQFMGFPLLGDPNQLPKSGLQIFNIPIVNELQQSIRINPANSEGNPPPHREQVPVVNPADARDSVGHVIFANTSDVERALDIALASKKEWAKTPVSLRADALETMADLLEENAVTLLALAMREAGKTLSNAIAEIREAVDFCRFYAKEARAHLDMAQSPPLGVVVAISPWNFPLAIFVGEVVSALVAGNTVIAKPAEQTTLIACFATQLLYKAGIPRNVLQCLPGRGEVVGAALTQSPKIDGVIFTGSTAVAKEIEKAIAIHTKSIILIAETGGQNAMIVDSSALPEQVVADVLASAFDSAGQRCSALRVLCLQTEIADKTIAMIQGAMAELKVGNPLNLATDVGPVIDREAQINLQKHIDQTCQYAVSVTHAPVDETAIRHGSFITPVMIELSDITELKQEVFGPVLHVIRFNGEDLSWVIDKINQLGFGLTHGIHSRIDETVDFVMEKINAGNIYVNRNIVGAVVGIQPFGGLGKSGTGPKAGGFLYLSRLTRAKTWSINQPIQVNLDSVRTAEIAARSAVLKSTIFSIKSVQRDPEQQAQIQHKIEAAFKQSPLDQSINLQGITGEVNVLTFTPRKKIAIFGCDLQSSIDALIAIVATGATAVITQDNPLARIQESERSYISVVERFDPNDFEQIIALEPLSVAMKQLMCAAPNRIIPIVEQLSLATSLYPLVHEQSVSINTAAAGGNASLMSLGA